MIGEQAARARPDLGYDTPVMTRLGRVTTPNESIGDVLSRIPLGELETGGMAMQAPANLAGIVGVTRGTQDIVKELMESQVQKHVQGQLRGYPGGVLGRNASSSVTEQAKGLAKNPDEFGTPETYRELLKQVFQIPGADPRKPVESIVMSRWLPGTIEQKAAVTKLSDFHGELDRLFEPDKLAQLRQWYNNILGKPEVKLPTKK